MSSPIEDVAPPEPTRPLLRWLRLALLGGMMAAGLSACAPRYAPSGPGPTSPVLALATPSDQDGALTSVAGKGAEPSGPQEHRLLFGTFQSADGLELPLRAWLPLEGEPQGVVLALHGFNDYANAFTPLGEALAARGIAVYAYDQRGFGEGPHVGLWSGGSVMTSDLRAAAASLRERFPDVPLVVLGESMGGAVVLAAESEGSLGVDGLILSAPAVWAREMQPWYQRAALWLAVRSVPWFRPSPRNIDRQASDNIEMLRALGQDPLVLRDARVDTIAGLVDLMDTALAAGPRVQTPTLLLYGERDEIIPSGPVERLWQTLPHDGGHRYLRYAEGWHLLTRDLQGTRVIADIAAWIADPQASLPSTAERLEVPAAAEGAEGEGERPSFADLSSPPPSVNVRPRAGP